MSCNYCKCNEKVEAYQFEGTMVSIEAIKTAFPTMVCRYTDNSGVAESVSINPEECPLVVNDDDYIILFEQGNFLVLSETVFNNKFEVL